MTSDQVVETSVTNNSSFQNYTHPDDHTIRTTDTPGFKPFTLLRVGLLFKQNRFTTVRSIHLHQSGLEFVLFFFVCRSRLKYFSA